MDFEKLNKIASDLEEAHLPNSAFGVMESKDILAIVQAYRILSAKAETTNESSGLHLQRVSNAKRTFSLDFIKWYSGMTAQKILNAFDRYKRESGNDC